MPTFLSASIIIIISNKASKQKLDRAPFKGTTKDCYVMHNVHNLWGGDRVVKGERTSGQARELWLEALRRRGNCRQLLL